MASTQLSSEGIFKKKEEKELNIISPELAQLIINLIDCPPSPPATKWTATLVDQALRAQGILVTHERLSMFLKFNYFEPEQQILPWSMDVPK